MPNDSLNIVIAHGSDDVRAHIARDLDDRHRVVAEAGLIVELRAAVEQHRPDLIVSGIAYPDGDGLDTLINLGQTRPLPAVIVTARRSIALVEKAMRDHVMAYLIEPVKKEELEAAIVVAWSRHEQLDALMGEVDDLRTALDNRKIIERAKGVLMATQNISEADAFATLRRRAQDARRKIADVADDVLKDQS